MFAKTFVIAAALLATSAVAQTQNADLIRKIDEMETGVERAEAVRAVKRLQYSYSHYLDAGLWSELADLFTNNGSAEFIAGKITRAKVSGKNALRQYWMKEVGRDAEGLGDGQLNTHLMMQPIVNLGPDGRTAKGTWHEAAMLGNFQKSATWTGGIYENDYVLDNGVWKISALHFYEQYRGAYEDPGLKGVIWEVPFHFTGDHVGVTIPQSALGPTVSKLAPAARVANLTARVEQMNDQTAVRNLQHSYGYYMDRKLWDDVADLFSPDGTWESGLRGVYVKPQIRKALEAIYGAPPLRYGELFDHINLGTVVTISADGRTAGARTSELLQIGLNNEYARWELGTYENEFVKQNGTWMIKAVRYYPRMVTDYDQGWGKAIKHAPAESQELILSHHPTSTYEIYPNFSFPAMHFVHPVTGKQLHYPEGVIKNVQVVREGLPKVASAKSNEELRAKVADAERALAAAIGVDAVENLMSSYGYYLDEGLWDDMANTFGLQGSKEITGAGVYVGGDRIREILKLRGSQGVGRNTTSYTIHQLVQPVIHVSADGKSANARLRLFQGGGRVDGASAAWIGGIYENTAFFENGEWKFGRQDLHHIFNATYRNGWAKFAVRTAQPAKPVAQPPKPAGQPAVQPAKPSLSSQMPPDRPIRARQYVFPEIDEPAFHYKNPVSGRIPKELLP